MGKSRWGGFGVTQRAEYRRNMENEDSHENGRSVPFLLRDRSYSFFGALLCQVSASLTCKSFQLNIFIS